MTANADDHRTPSTGLRRDLGLLDVGGITAMLGVILSQLLGLSRMGFAMARRGDLPRFLEQVTGIPILMVGVAARLLLHPVR